jgi:hypothetical protein
LNFKGTPSQGEHKTIFSGLTICKMALSDQSVVQLFHSSADPGQITSKCLFHYCVSHILVKSYKTDIIAYSYENLKKSDQLILDTGSGVLSQR